MKSPKNSKALLITAIAVIFVLLIFFAGLVLGLLAGVFGPNALNVLSETSFIKAIYKSSATIYISSNTEHTAVSSGDISAQNNFEGVLENLLNSKTIRTAISEEYPNIEYTLTIDSINETSVFTVTVESETQEYTDDICNLAVELLKEHVEAVLNINIKIVDYARQPSTPYRKSFLN